MARHTGFRTKLSSPNPSEECASVSDKVAEVNAVGRDNFWRFVDS